MPTEEKWDEYLKDVRQYLATGRLDPDEIDYKVKIGQKLADARSALMAGEDGWFDRFKASTVRQGSPNGLGGMLTISGSG